MKTKIFCIIFFLYYLSSNSQIIPKDHEVAIGKIYKKISEIDVFKNYKEYEGIAIEPLQKQTSFSSISDGKNTVVLYNKFIAPASRRVLAVLDLGMVDKSSRIIMARCRLNAKKDGEIIALAKPAKGDFFKNIIKAWRVDIKTNKFISISTKGIDCINDEDDAD
jgi:hypothetical protein